MDIQRIGSALASLGWPWALAPTAESGALPVRSCNQSAPEAALTGVKESPHSDKAPASSSPRLAIVSTPRSGNTWLRHILSATFGLNELTAHRPSEVSWNELPERCVLQIHWHRIEPFVSLLGEHGFRVVVLARHPLDIMISQLQWVVSCPHPRSVWSDNPALDGDRGTECSLLDATPTSSAFLEWALSPRADALLSVTRQWWAEPGSITLRYEDLVAATAYELRLIAAKLEIEPRRSPSEVAGEHTIDRLRRLRAEPSQHYWKGRPGLWKRFLIASDARRIAERHAESLSQHGYTCEPEEKLDLTQAEVNWRLRGLANW